MNGNTINASLDGTLENNCIISLAEIVVQFIFGSMGIAIVVLNSIVITGFVRDKKCREAQGNVFILNLAISDSLTGIFVCYIAVLNLWTFEEDFEYLLRIGMMSGFSVASSSFLTFLTIDRYLKVAMHLRYVALVTTRKNLCLCLAAWPFYLLLGILPALGWHMPVVKSSRFFETFSPSYIRMNATLGWGLPLLCIISAYIKLYMISNQHRKQIASQCQITSGNSDIRKSAEILKSILLMTGALVVCWSPVCKYMKK